MRFFRSILCLFLALGFIQALELTLEEKDWIILQSILNKGLQDLSEQESSLIISRWIPVEFESVNYSKKYLKWILGGLIIISFISLLFYSQNRRLKKTLIEKEEFHQSLHQTIEKLKIVNEEKTNILHSVSHDLRNPLSALRMNTELMIEEIEKPQPTPPLSVSLQFSLDIIQNMSHLIENILTLSTIESGTRQPKIQEVDLHPLLLNAMNPHLLLAKSKSIKFIFQQVSEPITLLIDPGMLRQVLDNFISNALKYTPKNKQITLSASLVELMNGKIGFESKLGQGSTFWVEFKRSK